MTAVSAFRSVVDGAGPRRGIWPACGCLASIRRCWTRSRSPSPSSRSPGCRRSDPPRPCSRSCTSSAPAARPADPPPGRTALDQDGRRDQRSSQRRAEPAPPPVRIRPAPSPPALRDGIAALQDSRCFYCREGLGSAAEADHFIPRIRCGIDAVENLVLADRRCNKDKRDLLPGPAHVTAWARRNQCQHRTRRPGHRRPVGHRPGSDRGRGPLDLRPPARNTRPAAARVQRVGTADPATALAAMT